MNSIGLAVCLLAGSAFGLLLMSNSPAGVDPRYGWALLALAMGCGLPAFLARESKRTFWCSLLIAAALAGCGRTLLIHPPVTDRDLAYYNAPLDSATVTVTGAVIEEPVLTDRSQRLRISAHMLKDRSNSIHTLSGDMYAIVPRYPEYSIGEVLSLSGHLTVPPAISGFDYAAYLARQGVYSYISFPRVKSIGRNDQGFLSGMLATVRANARQTLESTIAEPEASIVVGVVTGDRTTISDINKEAFRRSGTTHILAISGENISILVGVIWLLASGGKKRQRIAPWLVLTLLALIAAYTAFTGASPSVVRAAIMGAILVLGPVVGRRYDPVAALSLSAAIMVLLDPDLLADLGFQLSFSAMLGIAFIAPLFQERLPDRTWMRVVAVPLTTGTGVMLATLPVWALVGGEVSLVSPLSTLTADFALLPLMISGIATLLIGVLPVISLLTPLPATLAWLSSGWLLVNARVWSSLPFSTVPLDNISAGEVLTYYVILACAVRYFSTKRLNNTADGPQRHSWSVSRLVIPLLACVAIVIWSVAVLLILT